MVFAEYRNRIARAFYCHCVPLYYWVEREAVNDRGVVRLLVSEINFVSEWNCHLSCRGLEYLVPS